MPNLAHRFFISVELQAGLAISSGVFLMAGNTCVFLRHLNLRNLVAVCEQAAFLTSIWARTNLRHSFGQRFGAQDFPRLRRCRLEARKFLAG